MAKESAGGFRSSRYNARSPGALDEGRRPDAKTASFPGLAPEDLDPAGSRTRVLNMRLLLLSLALLVTGCPAKPEKVDPTPEVAEKTTTTATQTLAATQQTPAPPSKISGACGEGSGACGCQGKKKAQGACGSGCQGKKEGACGGSCTGKQGACGCQGKTDNPTAALVPPEQAKVGDRTTCVVSRGKFVVRSNTVFVSHGDKRYPLCCPGCAARFQKDPERFLEI